MGKISTGLNFFAAGMCFTGIFVYGIDGKFWMAFAMSALLLANIYVGSQQLKTYTKGEA